MTPPPINIDGTDITGATIDGQDVEQITIDGQDVLSAIPDSGIARYEFEEDVTDSFGDFDGIDNTSVGYETGQIGDFAKLFGGTDDSVDSTVGDNTIVGLDEITVTAYVKPDSLPSSSFVSFLSNTGGGNACILLRSDSGDLSWAFHTDTDGFQAATGNALSTDTYQFVAGTYSNTGDEWRIHQGSDAQQVNSGTHSGTITRQGSTERTVKIGASGAADDQFFDGTIDDPRIYSTALTKSELQNVANGDAI